MGSAILLGRDLERPDREKGDEKRRFFFSSFARSVMSRDIRATFSGVMKTRSGSSEPARDEVSDCESYITNQYTLLIKGKIDSKIEHLHSSENIFMALIVHKTW
jgi:hypothetical protein